MEDLVLSIEQCKYLQELGLDMSDSKLFWAIGVPSPFVVTKNSKETFNYMGIIPTYTLQEILDKLSDIIDGNGSIKTLYTWKINNCAEHIEYSAGSRILHACNYRKSTILEGAYNMLCWVIENGYLKTK